MIFAIILPKGILYQGSTVIKEPEYHIFNLYFKSAVHIPGCIKAYIFAEVLYFLPACFCKMELPFPNYFVLNLLQCLTNWFDMRQKS